MGCCASTPTDDEPRPSSAAHPPASPTAPYDTPTISPTRAINPSLTPLTATQPRPLQPPSLISRVTGSRQSSHSHAAAAVALHEHFNTPLVLPEPWSSTDRTWSHAQLQRERTEFFETRVTGRPEIWAALQNVSELIREGELETAQGILNAAAITTPTGNLKEGCYDEAGNLYRLPEVILLDPTNTLPDSTIPAQQRPLSAIDGDTMVGMAESKAPLASLDPAEGEAEVEKETDPEAAAQRRAEKGKGTLDRDAVSVRCRLSDRGGPDVTVLLGRTETVGVLARRVKAEANVAPSSRIRIAYLGKMLEEREALATQGWKEGHIVNALVTGPVPTAS